MATYYIYLVDLSQVRQGLDLLSSLGKSVLVTFQSTLRWWTCPQTVNLPGDMDKLGQFENSKKAQKTSDSQQVEDAAA